MFGPIAFAIFPDVRITPESRPMLEFVPLKIPHELAGAESVTLLIITPPPNRFCVSCCGVATELTTS